MDFVQLCLTSVLSYIILFVSAKITGRKQISQLDSFDYISGITIGSIAAEMATELEEPWKPLTAMIIYALITYIVTVVSLKVSRTRKYLNGAPIIVMDDGKLYRKNMKKVNLDLSEFMVMCREQGYFDLSSIQTAVFEFNGKLSILPVSIHRPATPEDLSLNPEQEFLFTEVIMDGYVLSENLRLMGLDERWLDKQLKAQGFESADAVFLALCDHKRNLSCYRVGGKDHVE